MSKRNINGKSGKQLYLNQLFLKGMLHTSSEMTEGYVKTLTNFDINPTGDSAVPRKPIVSYTTNKFRNNHTYPVKFAHSVNHQHFIEFTNTITEEEYISYNEDNVVNMDISNLEKGIKMYSRNKNSIAPNTTNINISGEGSDTSGLYDREKDDLTTLNLVLDSNSDLILRTDGRLAFANINVDDCIESNISDIESNSLHSTIKYPEFKLYDGDSGYLINSKGEEFHFRLIGINCPESGEEYYTYGKTFLQILLNLSTYREIVYRSYGKDKYDRNLINAHLKLKVYDLNTNSYLDNYVYINLNRVMVKMGLAFIDYAYENIYTDEYSIDFIPKLIEIRNKSSINLYNENHIDYFFNYAHNRINYPIIKLSSSNEYDNYIIQTVTLKEITYPSNKVANYLDCVNFIYHDYLDAVGFIGRIIDKPSRKILYKGPLYIKASYSRTYDPIEGVFSYECPNFTLHLPDNNLNGKIVNIVDGSTTGYNILDKNMLHIEDTNITSDPFGTIGLAVTDPTQDGIVIVDQAVRGQKVKLNAVTNLGYYYNSIIPNSYSDDYTFNIEFKSIRGESPQGFTSIFNSEYENLKISKSDFDKNSTYSTDIVLETKVKIPKEYDSIIYAGEHGIFDVNNYSKIRANITITSTDISVNNNVLSIQHEETINNKLNLNDFLNGNTAQFITGEFIPNSFFDIAFKLQIKRITIDSTSKSELIEGYYYYNVSVDLILDLTHNFNNFSKQIVYNTNTESFILNKRAQYPVSFFIKWERSNVDGTWTTIYEDDDYPTFYTTLDNNIVQKVENKQDDIIWNIDCNGNVQLKYTIIPKLKATTENDNWLSNVYIHNPLQEMYTVMPVFKIGANIKYINENDIRENVDIKNATRIGIFNRQVFLYGPYTKANFLQFSMFEEEYHFPFPYYNIEFGEPITYATNHQDSLVVFGKHNIWMLTGSVSVLECKQYKIYENLTTTLTDINLIINVGTYLMFANHNMFYILVPNTYSDDPTNIKVYKLSENIINLLNNPEHYLRSRLKIEQTDVITEIINDNTRSYSQNNEIYIINNYRIHTPKSIFQIPVLFIYNLDYKYWRMYDLPISYTDYIIDNYISEPNLNNQFITYSNEYGYCLTILNNINSIDNNLDIIYNNQSKALTKTINCFIESGYLSVDTMNDKRFKDLIIEFDRILSDLYIKCNFYIDGSPILITDQSALLVDKYGNLKEISTCIDLQKPKNEVHVTNINNYDDENYNNFYGVIYKIDGGNPTFVSNRTHLRIPLFGKGRLPSFSLELNSDKVFEFINYSIIYKEKNINRRR